jgi:type 1 glutamine amidotransferase
MNQLKRLMVTVLLAASTTILSAANAAPTLKVLMIGGDDAKGSHNWWDMAAGTRAALVDSGKFEVKLCEDAAVLESAAALQRYDVVFLTMFNASVPTLSPVAKENLLNFVKNGKGFVFSHLAAASFKEWDEFKQLCGRNWIMGKSGHGPRAKFSVKIADKNHPITKGITDFEADDELYAKLEGTLPIHVLLEAYSDWSKKTEPLAFIKEYGKGRVFYEAFGHDTKALENPAVRQLIAQGCAWAAQGKTD